MSDQDSEIERIKYRERNSKRQKERDRKNVIARECMQERDVIDRKQETGQSESVCEIEKHSERERVGNRQTKQET